jgi:hypothetical protein
MFDTNERALSLQGEKIQPTPSQIGHGGEPFFNYIGNEGYVHEFYFYIYFWYTNKELYFPAKMFVNFNWPTYGKYYLS